jgi:hypothetical protein
MILTAKSDSNGKTLRLLKHVLTDIGSAFQALYAQPGCSGPVNQPCESMVLPYYAPEIKFLVSSAPFSGTNLMGMCSFLHPVIPVLDMDGIVCLVGRRNRVNPTARRRLACAVLIVLVR